MQLFTVDQLCGPMTQLKDYIKQHPALMKFALLVQTGSVVKRSVTRRIRGQHNRIQIDQTAFCVGCVIDVVGNNKTIIGQESARRLNLRFFIRGNNNRIVVSSQVRVNRDGDLWIEDDGGTYGQRNIHRRCIPPGAETCSPLPKTHRAYWRTASGTDS